MTRVEGQKVTKPEKSSDSKARSLISSAPLLSLQETNIWPEKFYERHKSGQRGTPPELRKDRAIRDFIKTLTPRERKDWNDKEIVPIVRGIVHTLLANGVTENNLESMTRYALRSIFRDTPWNRATKIIPSTIEALKEASLGAKLLSPIILPLQIFCAASDGFISLIGKGIDKLLRRSYEFSGDSLGYWGSPVGSRIAISAKNPNDLGFVAAHEVSHMMQDVRDPHHEYFTFVTQASYEDALPHGHIKTMSWDATLNGRKLKGYAAFFLNAAAASGAIRTASYIAPEVDGYKTAEGMRFLHTISAIKEYYVNDVRPKLKATDSRQLEFK